MVIDDFITRFLWVIEGVIVIILWIDFLSCKSRIKQSK